MPRPISQYQLFPRRHACEEVRMLKCPGHPLPRPSLWFARGQDLTIEQHHPGARRLNSAKYVEQRGFAGAVWSDQSHETIWHQCEVDMGQRVNGTEIH
jgi:hypothetical protein